MSSEKFMCFVPDNLKSLIDKLHENERDKTIKWLDKIINRKSIYCGHCDKLIKCSGPCETDMVRGWCDCTGGLCYQCYKGDTQDSPCPLYSTKEERDEYWENHFK